MTDDGQTAAAPKVPLLEATAAAATTSQLNRVITTNGNTPQTSSPQKKGNQKPVSLGLEEVHQPVVTIVGIL